MSLFDVIRYPIKDIYDNDELEALPEDLYKEWFIRCAGKYTRTPMPQRTTEIKIMVQTQAIDSIRNNRFKGSNDSYEDLWKAIFTKMLKEMIKDYDPH
jgi:hypothetical protein